MAASATLLDALKVGLERRFGPVERVLERVAEEGTAGPLVVALTEYNRFLIEHPMLASVRDGLLDDHRCFVEAFANARNLEHHALAALVTEVVDDLVRRGASEEAPEIMTLRTWAPGHSARELPELVRLAAVASLTEVEPGEVCFPFYDAFGPRFSAAMQALSGRVTDCACSAGFGAVLVSLAADPTHLARNVFDHRGPNPEFHASTRAARWLQLNTMIALNGLYVHLDGPEVHYGGAVPTGIPYVEGAGAALRALHFRLLDSLSMHGVRLHELHRYRAWVTRFERRSLQVAMDVAMKAPRPASNADEKEALRHACSFLFVAGLNPLREAELGLSRPDVLVESGGLPFAVEAKVIRADDSRATVVERLRAGVLQATNYAAHLGQTESYLLVFWQLDAEPSLPDVLDQPTGRVHLVVVSLTGRPSQSAGMVRVTADELVRML